MKKGSDKKLIKMLVVATICALLCGCGEDTANTPAPDTKTTPTGEASQSDNVGDTGNTGAAEDQGGADFTEGYGDTFSGQTVSAETVTPEPEEPKTDDKNVDLILFMGQSNMSGAAGDASLAPAVSEEAGMEFRAISDPTRLYPITEPFGINENDPNGLHEYPGAKKGSLVSAFVNEYHKLTQRRVIAVSMSMGATDTGMWKQAGVITDVKNRYDRAVSYLTNSGYHIENRYAIWLHGESDGMEGTKPDAYSTALDDIMRGLFIGGLQKVFIITPGRTIDYKDIFKDIIDIQKQICADSDYYGMATTILNGISAEYMRDQFHYNQHVLNLVGIRAAQAVAYYTNNGVEMTVYDYASGDFIYPRGADPETNGKEEPIDLSSIDIDEEY